MTLAPRVLLGLVARTLLGRVVVGNDCVLVGSALAALAALASVG